MDFVISTMTNDSKITNEEFTQGRYIVIFPDEMDKNEIEMVKNYLFAFLQRHSCKIRKIEDETNSNT